MSRETYWGTWAEYSAVPQELDAGDQVIAEVQERGEGKGSGVPFERRHFLRAVGLSE